MTLPLIIHITTLLALAFRIMLFTSHGRRRPVVAWLAYVIMVAAFTEVIFAATGMAEPPGWPGLLLEFALTLAVYCHAGNVAELFKPTSGSRLGKWLCWSPAGSSRQPGPPPPPQPPTPPQPRQLDRRKHQRRKTDQQHKVTS